MFQSRRLSSQFTKGRCHRSGENRTRPSSTASFAGPREPAHLHEPLEPGDPRFDLAVAAVAVAHRVQVGPLLPTTRPSSSSASRTAARAAYRSRPVELLAGTASLRVASASRMFISGSPVRCAMSKSFGSCAGVTFTAPVPNSRSTWWSATMGISRPSNGMRDGAPDQRRVPLVPRMHGDAGVAEHRLDARRGDLDAPVPSVSGIAERDELPLDLLVLDLGVGQTGAVGRTPVHEPLAPVDQPGLVQSRRTPPAPRARAPRPS